MQISATLNKLSYVRKPADTNLEIEARFFIDERKSAAGLSGKFSPAASIQLAKDLIAKYKDKPKSISQTINFIADDRVKQLVFEDGVQQKDKALHYRKVQVIHPITFMHNELPACRLTANFETRIPEFPMSAAKHARVRLRYSISIGDWQLDMTLVKNVTDFNNVSVLKTAKSQLLIPVTVANFCEVAPWSLADTIEFELEFIPVKNKKFNVNMLSIMNDIFDGLTQFTALGVTVGDTSGVTYTYQSIIYSVAQRIRPADAYKFKQNDGLKQLSNQVIELDKNMFLSNVLSIINTMYITDKVDGKRAIIYYDGDAVYAITDTLTKLPITHDNTKPYILDTEEYEGKYYIFDVLYDGASIVSEPFALRMKHFSKFVDYSPLYAAKPFVLLSDDFREQLKEFKSRKRPYEVDGIILTPKNGLYESMQVYKYKPIDKLTIDFLVKKCPTSLLGISPYEKRDGHTLYLLFVGIQDFVFRKLSMKLIKHYEDIFPAIDTKRLPRYFPIQFEPSDATFSYLYWSTDVGLDNCVGEFAYVDNAFTLHKIRTDRAVEVLRGNYFGNNYKVAEMTWLSYSDPLVIEDIAPSNYFLTNDNQLYKASRGFHSFVKAKILANITNKDTVIDMASGKGQDLFRYGSSGVHSLVCLEIDKVAIMELNVRKHMFSKGRDGGNMHINLMQVDLNDDYKTNIDKLENIQLQPGSVDLISCNFALHYLIEDKAHIQNVFKFVTYYLKTGGRFQFTTFDAKDVIRLLNVNAGNYNVTEGGVLKYSIKRKYKVTTLEDCGQKIDVLLPFSGENYYTEYLLNIDYLASIASKLNMALELDQSFSEYLDDFKKENATVYSQLTPKDKEYSSLYHVYTFYKVK